MINKELAKDQGLSVLTIALIEGLHEYRKNIFLVSEESRSNDLQRALYKEWYALEQELQILWKFDQDDNKIKFWNFPACSCPKMDNNDNYPYGYYVYSGGCIVHGDKVNVETKDYWDNLEKICKDAGEEWDDRRMDVIGQNGNDGLHY